MAYFSDTSQAGEGCYEGTARYLYEGSPWDSHHPLGVLLDLQLGRAHLARKLTLHRLIRVGRVRCALYAILST